MPIVGDGREGLHHPEGGLDAMTQGVLIQWKCSLKRRYGVRVYRLSGLLTDTPEAFDFVEKVRSDLQKDPRPILLDLRDVKRVTSAGVGLIASIFVSAKTADRLVALCGLTPAVGHILEMVQMNLVVAIFKTADEALKASSQPGWARP